VVSKNKSPSSDAANCLRNSFMFLKVSKFKMIGVLNCFIDEINIAIEKIFTKERLYFK
jgi:hypothetical protein